MTHKEYESKSQMKRVEILKAGEKKMAHEDLLAKIDERHWKLFNYNYQDQTLEGIEFRKTVYLNTNTLRAVVELHKPNELNLCEICRWYMNKHKYPCPTIQAIEKKLS